MGKPRCYFCGDAIKGVDVMINGGDEDKSKYGVDDIDERLKEQYTMKNHIEHLEGEIKIHSKQVVERDDLLKRVYERIDSEVLRKEVDNIIPKWDDNIPEHGVLCWVQYNPEGKKKVVTIYSRKNRDDYETTLYWIDSRTIVTPLTNEEIEEFKR
jgi:hypothetical protein